MEKEWVNGSDGKNLKFKRETLLNYGMNRWGLNKVHSVGSTSELIRSCAPNTYEDWESYYFVNAAQKKKNGIKITQEYITELGKTLYIKLTEVVQKELLSITEEECIEYAFNLVLNRTFEGYKTEIETIYGQLESEIGNRVEPSSDSWDRSYSVDFFIRVSNSVIGLQIKPIASGKALNQYQWIEMHRQNHEKFTKKFGGKVFFIYSIKSSNGKRIYNEEVIDEIKTEIHRLENL